MMLEHRYEYYYYSLYLSVVCMVYAHIHIGCTHVYVHEYRGQMEVLGVIIHLLHPVFETTSFDEPGAH